MAATYNGTSIQVANYSLWFDVRKGLKESAEVRGINTTIPGAVGEIPRNRVKDRLEIELYGWIKAASWSAYWTAVKALLALFDVTGGDKVLSIGLDDGSTATINATPLDVLPEGDEAIGAAQYFSIRLEAVNPPYWTFT